MSKVHNISFNHRILVTLSTSLLFACQSTFIIESEKTLLNNEPLAAEERKTRDISVHAPQLEICTFPRYRKIYQENHKRLEVFILKEIEKDGRLPVDAQVVYDYSFQSYFMGVPIECPDNAYWYNGFSLTLLPGWTYTTIILEIKQRNMKVLVKAIKLNIFHLVTSRPPPFSFIIGAYDDWPQPVERRFDPVHIDLLVKMLYSGLNELYQDQNIMPH